MVLIVLAALALLACRTVDLVTNALQSPPSPTRIAQGRPTRVLGGVTPTRSQPGLRTTATHSVEPSEAEATPIAPTVAARPTRPLQPTAPPPTRRATAIPATLKPAATEPPAVAASPAPTRCPFKYCAVNRGCQTDPGNTLVEGIVYAGGVPESGVAVRVALKAGAYPLTDDFVSGTDPINPGKPDPNNPGRYLLQIKPGKAEEGNWWVFVVDRAGGTRQNSEAVLVHTNDDATNPANCQHAFIDFVR